MAAEQWQGDAAEAAMLEGGTPAWERLHERIAHRFKRVEMRARAAVSSMAAQRGRTQERRAGSGSYRRGGATWMRRS